MPDQIKTHLPVSHPSSLELTEEIIRVRAYELFVHRGYEHGHDVEDWIIAEAEVLGKKPPVSAKEGPVKPTVAVAA
jgi:hypothetical protein